MISISLQLKKIQEISSLTQIQIATKLGVSFATVNSWINNRSTPHAKTKVKIENLFEFYVQGKTQIAQSDLTTKKQNLYDFAKKHDSIVTKIDTRPDIKEQFLLSLTYNTNRIEGSTMTQDDTASVLFDNISIPNKTLTEHLEIKNHQLALIHIFDLLSQSKTIITEELILQLHQVLMNAILPNAGKYRTHPVRIVGSNVPTTNHYSIATQMQKFIKLINTPNIDTIAQIAKTHAQFEQIHPFTDGNGRIGRLLMHILAMQSNFPPILVENQRKRVYYTCLRQAQLHGEYQFLEDFICDCLLASYQITT